MGFETVSKLESPTVRHLLDERDLQPLNFSVLEKVQGGYMDKARNLTYTTAVILGAIASAEKVESAEIPSNATYEEGIALLHKGALEDTVETGAYFVKLSDAEGFWISTTGEAERVTSVLNLAEILSASRTGDEIRVVELESVHTHPIHSIKVASSNNDSVVTRSKTISAPPSNGYTGMGIHGDTDKVMRKNTQTYLNLISRNFNATITYTERVIDPLGVWTYEQYPPEKWAELAPEAYLDYRKTILGYNSFKIINAQGGTGEMTELNDSISDMKNHGGGYFVVNDNLNNAITTWIVESQDKSAEELVGSDTYRNLIQAYAESGVRVSFQPFEVTPTLPKE